MALVQPIGVCLVVRSLHYVASLFTLYNFFVMKVIYLEFEIVTFTCHNKMLPYHCFGSYVGLC